MTEEQEAKWNRFEKALSNWFWGIVAAGIIVLSVCYGPWVP